MRAADFRERIALVDAGLHLPDSSTSNSSAAAASRSARFAMYENSVGRVKNSEPRDENSFESIGGSSLTRCRS